MAELERTGVSLVVENANKANSDLATFNKTLGQTAKATEQASKVSFKGLDISGALSKNVPIMQKLNSAIGQFVPGLGKATSAAGGLQGALTSGLTPAVIGVGVAFAGAAVAAAGFWKLGVRGAQLQPTITAFGNLVGSVTDATGALNQIRADTRGTISDFEIMRLTTSALTGTSREFRTAIVNDFGVILDGSRRIAQATGESADIIQEKFIRGLRLSSAKLIDDIGVKVDVEKANAAYAESIGKATAALTDQEKQTAFAIAAVSQLKTSLTEFGEPIGVLDALKIPLVAITNILDKLSLAIQPAFQPIAQIIADVFNTIQQAFTFIYPIINALAGLFGQLISTFRQVGESVFNFLFAPFLRLAGDVIPYVIAAFKLMVNGITAAVRIVGNIVSGVFNAFASIRDKIFGDTSASIETLAFNLARGGGFVIGSFAAGLLQGGKYVVIAVTKIAQIVADFLQGFSPPKEGPLSEIDKGGENIAKSWIDGFKSQFLKPVEQVAAEVNQALGTIGTFTREQVEGRLAALDTAIQPFVEQAKIAKSQFEAIAGFIDPALEALDRQRKIALEQFAQGEISADQLRALDEQFVKLSEVKAQQQAVTDAAAIQLGLAQAQQAEERALLDIQLARLGAVEETATATTEALKEAKGGKGIAEKEEKEAKAKEEKVKAGAGEAATEGTAAAPFTGGEAPDLLSNAAIDHATEVLKSGFNKGLEDAGFDEALAGFTSATGELGTQLARVAESDPVQGIVDKFGGLTEGVGSIVDQFKSVVNGITTTVANVATNVTIFLDTIKRAFDNVMGSAGIQRIIGDANLIIGGIGTAITTVAGVVGSQLSLISGLFSSLIGGAVQSVITRLVGEEGLAKISSILTTLGENIGTLLEPIKNAFQSVFGGGDDPSVGINGALQALVAPEGLLGENGLLVNTINTVFAPGGLIDAALAAVPAMFDDLRIIVEATINALMDFLNANFLTPFNVIKDGILLAINAVIEAFGNLPATLNEKLSGLGAALTANFGMPFQSVVNRVLQAAEEGINTIIEGYNSLPLPDIDLVNFGRVNVFAAARGGLGLKGLGIVGEKGPELVNFGRTPTDVFPANMTKGLLGMMAQAQAIPLRSQANTSSNTSIDRSRNFDITFNNSNANQSLLYTRQLEALG